MLSRVASSLYWLGRYVERVEFTSRLVEATLRFDAVAGHVRQTDVWAEALDILDLKEAYAGLALPIEQTSVAHFLTLDNNNPSSVVRCLDAARDNARAVRISLSKDAWSAINRAWLLFRETSSLADTQAALELVERAEIETRAFEGAIGRMLRNPASLFVRLGAAVERADCAIRLIETQRSALPPDPRKVASVTDRDRWQMLLQAMSAVNAYRWLYSEGLKPKSVFELLLLRRVLPRSLAACAEESMQILNGLGKHTGTQGEADREARDLHAALSETDINKVLDKNLEGFLTQAQEAVISLHNAIGRQFRFH